MARPLLPLMAALAVLTLFVTACGSKGPSDAEVLISLADEVAVPAFQEVAQDMGTLHEASQTLCQNPEDAALGDAQQAWRDARASWMTSEAMWFGPVMDRRSRSLMDWSPTDAEGVEETLARDIAFTAGDIRETLASNRRGLGAIEYILFDDGAVDSLKNAPARCSFLTSLTDVAGEEAEAIRSAWVDGADGSPPYKDYLTGRSDLSLLASEGVAEAVRTQVFLIRDIVEMRLATALGLRGEPDLTFIPGTVADNGLADLRHELLGMQRIYEGAGGESLGISHLIQPLSEETDQRLREQFTAALTAIDAVDGTLKAAIDERPDQVREVHDRLSDLRRTIATEVVSLLGVSVGFTDTDGDTLR